MPGLIRGVARTAVIAGTATAVSNRVSRRQAGRWAAQEQTQYEHEAYQQQQQAQQQYAPPPQQYAAPPPQQYAAPPPPPSSSMEDKLAQLKQLGELKDQGVLTELEFEQQKARVLAS
jgi:type II secretory pathway pseudopilin PulG